MTFAFASPADHRAGQRRCQAPDQRGFVVGRRFAGVGVVVVAFAAARDAVVRVALARVARVRLALARFARFLLVVRLCAAVAVRPVVAVAPEETRVECLVR